MKKEIEFDQWCKDQHAAVNQTYGGGVPYSFHLDMVYKNTLRFELLYNEKIDIGSRFEMKCASFGHDLMEDTRLNYNDIKTQLIYCGSGKSTAENICEIIRACTNDGRGRNRKERMTDAVYRDIAMTSGATFIKICDRIANVQYSAFTGSRMFDLYRDEHDHFKSKLYQGAHYPMWEFLESLYVSDPNPNYYSLNS